MFQFTRPRARRCGCGVATGDGFVSPTRPRGATCSLTSPLSGTVFNPRAASATRLWLRMGGSDAFQFTRARRDLQGINTALGKSVSIHAPARGATFSSCILNILAGFNSRAREGRDPCNGATRAPGTRFNSRAREGRDHWRGVSWARLVRFNSRAREGRDHLQSRGAIYVEGFNSRAREGRDGCRKNSAPHGRVSIHAPARGATER